MFLNADVPRWQCLIRREYLYDLQDHHGETEPVVVFGLASRPGYALGFHVMTEAGAVIWRVPISALVHKPDAPVIPLDHLQLWDAFSPEVSVHEFDWLAIHHLLNDRGGLPAILGLASLVGSGEQGAHAPTIPQVRPPPGR